ncbi:hypothetical protein OG413_44435 [Streptomyces sp. NBC_01433]|uniref:hypothetical protein n=1 Tax=Streptomyces sp. NBC_01433 TaxID=2903864 RepID=UPI0022591EC1|nr:hypothetical protein [Streptomyces sp. NBC_01433]MCX4682233.1 hypothetical protein [Streptomyces sp. NBC_01433]
MTATMTDVRERDGRELVDLLRVPVRNVLTERADGIRRTLPPRPSDARGRHEWLRSLDENQARRAALLDRLDALCGHLSGRQAPGYAPVDLLPAEALEEADGFTGESTARLTAEYRRTKLTADPERRAPPEGRGVVSGTR